MPVKRWMSAKPSKCDICSGELKKVFFDAPTAFGPWAIMCEMCRRDQGTKIGQKYDLVTLEKISG